MKKKERRRTLTVTILSLSLLTVMAGAAVAPALNVIQEYFVEADRAMVQMIISVPALLIALTSLVFPHLCKVFKARTLTLIGLLFYTAGGVAAGLFNSIYMVLLFRGLVAFAGGLAFVHIRRVVGQKIKYAAPILFLTGYIFLMLDSGWIGTLVGSALVGFANGLSIPFIIASAGKKAGRMAATTVMPLLSLAMYLAQFITPVLLSVGSFHPYVIAAGSAAIFVLWSIKVKDEEQGKDRVIQEREAVKSAARIL